MIFCVSFVFTFVLRHLLRILSTVMRNEQNVEKLEASRRAVQGTLVIVVCVCFFCVVHLLIDVEYLYDYLGIVWNHPLSNCILHSVFLISVGFAFMMLVFDNKKL